VVARPDQPGALTTEKQVAGNDSRVLRRHGRALPQRGDSRTVDEQQEAFGQPGMVDISCVGNDYVQLLDDSAFVLCGNAVRWIFGIGELDHRVDR
jgi:hypothetical protein